MTEQEMLNQTNAAMNSALTIAKVYIDQSSTADRAYVDTQLQTVLQTTDLNAKLALLEQINGILDGDNATAGFQAWQAEVGKLATLRTEMDTAKGDITTLYGNVTTINTNLSNLSTTLGQRITDEVATLNATITTKDTATNTRIDGIVSGIATDKIAQVEKDATQSAAIAAEKARVDVLVGALADEATARTSADTATNTRVTAAENAISTLQANSGDFATKAQVVSVMAQMVTVAETVFGINAQGQSVSGGAVI
ncbi:hypothetical protein [Thiothrix sp.]|jgi:hypothetical protein|uniref:hypothetical protein n=1 Tax=Thiothrix sp. TaxID=1032 RepID=UPI00257B6CC7|nr:hypothetical protein [Thiothrix sp.]